LFIWQNEALTQWHIHRYINKIPWGHPAKAKTLWLLAILARGGNG
jgi:hypothetical protein